MNLRCMYCQTMFGLSREGMLIGLQTMVNENLTHFDFYCPKCRRANRVERIRLERANPNWQENLKALAKETEKAQKEQAATEPARSSVKPKAAPKPAPANTKKVVEKKAAVKTTTSKPAAKTPVTAKPVAKPKQTTSKTTAKPKAPATKKPATTKKPGTSSSKAKVTSTKSTK